jgi:hypothetical protein
MAVRIHHPPRRRRESSLPPATVAPLLVDETALLDRTEQVLDDIETALATS